MIGDVDRVMQNILDDPELAARFPELAEADISFQRPVETFKPATKTVDLFLYDIAENVELRSNEPTVERLDGQARVSRPPRRVACSYLITAWPGSEVSGEEAVRLEHKLLGQVLQVLSAYPTIPDRFLLGTSLEGQEPPLPMVAAQPDGLKESGEFWTSLGNQLRASFTATVTVGVPVFAEAATVPTVTTKLTEFQLAEGKETPIQIGGRVQTQIAQEIRGISGAIVDILDVGLRTQTDAGGRYSFWRVPAGTHSIRATAAGFQTVEKPLDVPGKTEDYQITMTSL